MGYFIADIYYLLDKSIIHDMNINNIVIMILHHCVTISCLNIIFVIDNNLVVLARYILSRFCLAEIAIIPLNYSWYLINTKQIKTIKFKIISIITLISYLIFRIINFTTLFYELFILEHYKYMLLGSPLILFNYYWFYKLIKKVL